MKVLSYLLTGVVLFSLMGCKPAQQENEPARATSVPSQPQHFKKTSGEPENFNRDLHVLRTLWAELSATDPSSEKYALLIKALREKVAVMEPFGDLSKTDLALVKEIQIFLNP